MAIANPVKEVGSQLVSKILSSILWFGIGAIVVGVISFLVYYFLVYRKKFDIKVKIQSERADGQKRILFDKAAILTDRRTGHKYFKIWGLKVELPVPTYNVLQNTNEGDMVEIWRKTENEFVYLMPPRIDRQTIIKADGRLYPFASQEQKQVDADIEFWNVKRKEKNKGVFSTENLLMKILPFIPHIIGGVITIFVLYILLDNLPQILGSLKELTVELRSLKTAEVTRVNALWMNMMN